MKLPKYATRILLACMILPTFALTVSWIIALRKSNHDRAGLGIQLDVTNWPYDLREIVAIDPSLQEGVTPYGISAGFDRCSIWRLAAGAPLLDHLQSETILEDATLSHPMALTLIDSLPKDWPKQDWGTSKWFATPGYGTRHMECVDLYLIAVDAESGETLVLHENHF